MGKSPVPVIEIEFDEMDDSIYLNFELDNETEAILEELGLNNETIDLMTPEIAELIEMFDFEIQDDDNFDIDPDFDIDPIIKPKK